MIELGRVFGTRENIIRKLWLLSTFCFFALPPIFVSVFVLFFSFPSSMEEVISIVLGPIMSILPILFGYHFVYKKQGEKFLTLWVIWVVFNQFRNIGDTLVASPDGLELLLLAFQLSLSIWWSILSFKIKAVNKAIQKQRGLETV